MGDLIWGATLETRVDLIKTVHLHICEYICAIQLKRLTICAFRVAFCRNTPSLPGTLNAADAFSVGRNVCKILLKEIILDCNLYMFSLITVNI